MLGCGNCEAGDLGKTAAETGRERLLLLRRPSRLLLLLLLELLLVVMGRIPNFWSRFSASRSPEAGTLFVIEIRVNIFVITSFQL